MAESGAGVDPIDAAVKEAVVNPADTAEFAADSLNVDSEELRVYREMRQRLEEMEEPPSDKAGEKAYQELKAIIGQSTTLSTSPPPFIPPPPQPPPLPPGVAAFRGPMQHSTSFPGVPMYDTVATMAPPLTTPTLTKPVPAAPPTQHSQASEALRRVQDELRDWERGSQESSDFMPGPMPVPPPPPIPPVPIAVVAQRQLSPIPSHPQPTPLTVLGSRSSPPPAHPAPSAVSLPQTLRMESSFPVADVLALHTAGLRMNEAEQRILSAASEVERQQEKERAQHAEAEGAAKRRLQQVKLDWDERDHDWERACQDERARVQHRMEHANTVESRIALAEAALHRQVQEAASHYASKRSQTEEQRRRTTALIEERLRLEVEEELTQQLRRDQEAELAPRIAAEVGERLRADFEQMCKQMKDEVERARERMREEIERAVEPRIETRLLPTISQSVETEVQETVLASLREASSKAQELRKELQSVLTERKEAGETANAVMLEHRAALSSINEELVAERAVAEELRSKVAVAAAAVAIGEREREQYPLLAEVDKAPEAWIQAYEQLCESRREGARWQANSEFAQREADSLLEQLGIPGPAQLPQPSPPRPRSQLPWQRPPGRMQSVESSGFPRRPPKPTSPVNSAVGDITAQRIPAPNRFRHAPDRREAQPTFPLTPEDRQRVFFKEMEILREQTQRTRLERRQREAESSQTAPYTNVASRYRSPTTRRAMTPSGRATNRAR